MSPLSPRTTPASQAAAGRERWPDFFIVGAAKAGTTSVYRYLRRHPRIFMSPVKEPHYFSQVKPDPRFEAYHGGVTDRDAYLRLFAAAPADALLGEASTSYLWDEHAPRRIRAVRPDARIVALLREPGDRAHSHYLNDVREGLENRPFVEALQADLGAERTGWGVSSLYVELARYCDQLERWFRDFPREQILVLFFEELVADVPGHLRRLCAFLGVEAPDSVEGDAHNPYRRPRHPLAALLLGHAATRRAGRALLPPRARAAAKRLLVVRDRKPGMDEGARALLDELYSGEAACLERLLGRPVPWSR